MHRDSQRTYHESLEIRSFLELGCHDKREGGSGHSIDTEMATATGSQHSDRRCLRFVRVSVDVDSEADRRQKRLNTTMTVASGTTASPRPVRADQQHSTF
jgi:hypothetical protein